MNVLMESGESTPLRVLETHATGKKDALAPREKTVPRPWRRRSDRVTLGFWLGGISLGAVGCAFGACMSYQHHTAVAMSVIWWGIYLGCFGASLGGLLGLFATRIERCQEPFSARKGS